MTDRPLKPAPLFPPIFHYSQDNLQDYVECARRFQLRHLVRQPWPAPLAEPLQTAEIEVQRGEQFHRLLERHFLTLSVHPPPGPLSSWWRAFQKFPPLLPDEAGTLLLPEAFYSVPFNGRRLVAKFDLLTIVPGERIVIVDWKTAQHRPSRQLLAARLQTAVYRYVAVEALAASFGRMVPPEAVQLIYWFANAPQQPEVFLYDAAEYQHTGDYLRELISGIEARPDDAAVIWPLTPDIRQCAHCNYRSFCDRGTRAAPLDPLADTDRFDEDTPLEIEW